MNRKQRRAGAMLSKGGSAAPAPPNALPPPLADVLATGLRHQQSGRLMEAEACYRQVLAAHPDHPPALYLSGLLALGRGQPAAAVELIGRALARDARHPGYHYHFGTGLAALGRHQDAIGAYRDALRIRADLPEVHLNLGNAFCALGRPQEAEAAYGQAIRLRPDYAEAYSNLGNALKLQGKLEAAVAACQESVRIQPNLAGLHANLGDALRRQGRLAEAAAACAEAVRLNPSDPNGHANLGLVLYEQGRFDEAAAAWRTLTRLRPADSDAQSNLGNALMGLGRAAEAIAAYRQAIKLRPDNARAHSNLGNILRQQGQIPEAIAACREAIRLQPDYIDAACNLCLALLDNGDVQNALAAALHAFALQETPATQALVARCLSRAAHVPAIAADTAARRCLVRALSEPWGRPSDLAGVAVALLKQDDALGPAIARATAAWPLRVNEPGLGALCSDALLLALLDSTPVCDVDLERFLTAARARILERVANGDGAADDDVVLQAACALAQQCFVNEYVFALQDGEMDAALRLRAQLVAALDSGAAVPPLLVATVAAYCPLGALPDPAALTSRSWPAAVEAVLARQIREPAEERTIGATIPRLTPINDAVSQAVREQYEENPYPRWVRLPLLEPPAAIEAYLRSRFPSAPLRPVSGPDETLEVLIAGCGTGQQAIETAQRFATARVLAIDLSLASLSYAQRQTRRCGLRNIAYAQADILELGTLARSFHLIEAGGVLHHLAEPLAGWRRLIALLRPGGVMRIGLYSARAREDIAAAQAFVAGRGNGRSADEIREARQELISASASDTFSALMDIRDFYSTSECRDLLFHRMEQRFTLPRIRAFLAEQGLQFLGFDVDSRIAQHFRSRNPAAAALADLDAWDRFEAENPRAFLGMYQFYVQKP